MEPISVIIPAFGRPCALRRAVDSALAGGMHVEVIVVDDGSPEPLAPVLRDLPVRVLRQDNAGPAAARNAGVAVASGHWLHFLDADDVVLPGLYDAARRGLRGARSTTVWTCATRVVYPDGGGRRAPSPSPGPLFPRLGDDGLLFVSSAVLPTALFRRTGGFDPDLPACEDWDLWLQIGRCGAVNRSSQRLGVRYHLQAGSRSGSAEAMFAGTERCLQRARSADARVRDPHPAHAAGLADGRSLDEAIARAAWIYCGKAVAAGDVAAVRGLAPRCQGAPPARALADQVRNELRLAGVAPGALASAWRQRLQALRDAAVPPAVLEAVARGVHQGWHQPLGERLRHVLAQSPLRWPMDRWRQRSS